MKSLCTGIMLLLSVCSMGQLTLAGIFSDNMVLQRNKPIQLWGKAVPGKQVTISFAQRITMVKAKDDSIWSASMAAQEANGFPQTITISAGSKQIELHNILVGDVWVCIGQSNMEWPMQREMHFAEEQLNSNQPLLRFYNPSYAGKNIFGTPFSDSVIQRLHPEQFYRGSWKQCDSNSLKTMSAVAYYFGKSITKEINVPIGLVNLAIGGAPLETFIDPVALQQSKQFAAKVNGDWLQNNALPTWVCERGQQNVGTKENVPADLNGKNHAYKPGFAYKAGIEPLHRLHIKGILHYQGESNAQEQERVDEYAKLSALMIKDYRKKWHNPKLPIYFVQLSSIDSTKYKSHLWPQFRDEQRKMLEWIKYSGMAVCSDIGERNNIHPTNKKDVGERLARWALHKTYKQDIIPSGPLPVKAIYSHGKVMVRFEYRAKGIKTSDGKKIQGFSIDGEEITGAIFGKNALIFPVGSKPQYIYYGWKPFSDGNLINSENLPASTFKIPVN